MFWLWAPHPLPRPLLHVGLRERTTFSRWVEMAFHVPVFEGAIELALGRVAASPPFRMNGSGYDEPTGRHGTSQADLEVCREERHVDELDPTIVNNMHIRSIVAADRRR